MAELSVDLRRRLVEAYQSKKSGTYATTAALFGVGEATVSRNLRRYRETGDVAYKPKGGNNPRRVDLEWLRGHLAREPDARLTTASRLLHEQPAVTVSLLCKRSGLLRGQTTKNGGRPRARSAGRPGCISATFVATQDQLEAARLVFLDEFRISLLCSPNYGWAPLGEKSPGKATNGAWCSMTMIGALALDGWRLRYDRRRNGQTSPLTSRKNWCPVSGLATSSSWIT